MADGEVKTQFGHEHSFVYMRQEEEPIYTWGDRIERREYYDVFYCEGCLEYKRIKVMVKEPSRTSLEWDVTWRR